MAITGKSGISSGVELKASVVGESLLTAATTAAAQDALGGGTVGKQLFAAATTAAASSIVGGGFTGSATDIVFNPGTLVHVSGLNVQAALNSVDGALERVSAASIGATAIGKGIFTATTTAAAQNLLEAGAVGLQIWKAATTAAVVEALGTGFVTATMMAAPASVLYAGDGGGTADAITLTPTPALAAYAAGDTRIFRVVQGDNTGAVTVNISGLGAKAIKKASDTSNIYDDLVANDLSYKSFYMIVYDGTQYILTNPSTYLDGGNVTSATTIDLSVSNGDYFNVTGTTAITGVTLAQGRQAVIKFAGILTFTNGAALILPGAANITTAAGDIAILRGEASDVVRCISYIRAARPPNAVTAIAQGGTGAATTAAALSSLGGGAVGTAVFAAATTAAALDSLGGGAVGKALFATATTAAALDSLGAGTVGKLLLATSTTAAAQNALGGGTVGKQIFEAATTAAVTNITGGGAANFIKIAAATASNSASITFVNGVGGVVLDGTYKEYVFVLEDLFAITDASLINFRVSTDTGSTYRAGASDYGRGYHRVDNAGTVTTGGSAGDTRILLNVSQGASANETSSGIVRVFNPADVASFTKIISDIVYNDSTGAVNRVNTGNEFLSVSAVDGVQFIMSVGNISSGVITMYGVTP